MAITFDVLGAGSRRTPGHERRPGMGDGRPVELTLLPSHRGTVDDKTVRLAVRLIDGSGIVGRLASWKEDVPAGPRWTT